MKSLQFSFSTAPTEHSSASSCSAFWQISSSLSPGIAPQHPRERSGALRSGAAPLPAARLQPPAPRGRRPHPPSDSGARPAGPPAAGFVPPPARRCGGPRAAGSHQLNARAGRAGAATAQTRCRSSLPRRERLCLLPSGLVAAPLSAPHPYPGPTLGAPLGGGLCSGHLWAQAPRSRRVWKRGREKTSETPQGLVKDGPACGS